MAICPICDDTGLLNSDSTNPKFCYCAAGKQARRQWETETVKDSNKKQSSHRPPSFIDVSELEQVNASVEAMRASLFGAEPTDQPASTRHSAVQLLSRVAHPGHEISITEANQLRDLARSLESFLGDLSFIGRKKG